MTASGLNWYFQLQDTEFKGLLECLALTVMQVLLMVLCMHPC